MTTSTAAPMPGADLLTGQTLVEYAPIIPTLARQLVADLRAGHAIAVASITPDSATIAITYKGRDSAIDLYFDEGDSLTAMVYGGAEPARVNAPDRSLAREVLASLRGGR